LNQDSPGARYNHVSLLPVAVMIMVMIMFVTLLLAWMIKMTTTIFHNTA
jgi:hypothetical protein